MIRLAARTLADRWQLFVGTVLALTFGVAIVHAGMTIVLAAESYTPSPGLPPREAAELRSLANGASTLTGMTVVIGAFLTVFVVSSTFGFAVDERRRELAVLRLVGVTPGQARRLLLGEALLAALLGTGAGVALGLALTVAQTRALGALGTMPGDMMTPQHPGVLVMDLAIAVTVALLGARSASRRATRIPPLEALRRGDREARVMTWRRWATACSAALLTGVQVFFAATTGGMLIPLLLGLGIVLTGSVALSQLSPMLVPQVARMLTLWAGHNVVVELAVASLRDAVRRTASIAAPMIVLVALVMGLQGILDTQTAAERAEPEALLDADLIASGTEVDIDAIRDVPGVALAAPETTLSVPVRLVRGGAATSGPGSVVAVDPELFRATHQQQPVSGSVDGFGPGSVVLGPGLDSTVVGGDYDEVVLTLPGGDHALDQAARMEETIAGTDGFYVDRSIIPQEQLGGSTQVILQLDPGADRDAVVERVRATGVEKVEEPGAMAGDQATKNRENRGVMAAIIGLGSLYSLISVLSTIAMAGAQRRAEFATLRLAGVTKRQIRQAAVLEAGTSAVIGLGLGAVAAVLSLVGLWAATARVYGAPVIAIPWSLLLGLSLLVGILAAVVADRSTRLALRTPPVVALGARE
ncbi:FtsX-like permease family protein [Kytococcus sedentarius]|uniref:FtsX-like permease family protein n=1 Tax=Kytococcus sedentarius TaxID=1276 RepID=UPI00384C4F44